MNVPILCLLWAELAILAALIGSAVVSRLRDPAVAWRWGLGFTGATLILSAMACIGFYGCRAAGLDDGWSLQSYFFGAKWFEVDELSAPLIPLAALLHFLAALATGRTKMRRVSLSLSLLCEGSALAIFSCQVPWALVGLLCLGVVPGYLVLRNRGKLQRLYVVHMALFVVLLISGWWLVTQGVSRGETIIWATVPLLAAVLIRCGS